MGAHNKNYINDYEKLTELPQIGSVGVIYNVNNTLYTYDGTSFHAVAGGAGGAETDPIYTAEKSTLATKTDLSTQKTTLEGTITTLETNINNKLSTDYLNVQTGATKEVDMNNFELKEVKSIGMTNNLSFSVLNANFPNIAVLGSKVYLTTATNTSYPIGKIGSVDGGVGVATFTGATFNVPATNVYTTYNPAKASIDGGVLVSGASDTGVTVAMLASSDGTQTVFKEYDNGAVTPLSARSIKVGNIHSVTFNCVHTLTGSATSVLQYNIISVASSSIVGSGTIPLTASATNTDNTINFETISDANSLSKGYYIQFKSPTAVTVSLTRKRLIATAK